jgi:hypothetical protein
MSIRYDAERESFVDGKMYVPPAVMAEMLEQAKAEVETLDRTLRIAAADYWREQMDALATDHPVDHIIDATIAKWIARAEEGSES